MMIAALILVAAAALPDGALKTIDALFASFAHPTPTVADFERIFGEEIAKERSPPSSPHIFRASHRPPKMIPRSSRS
jgi:hypothetical protein